jgi:hypothetical protein
MVIALIVMAWLSEIVWSPARSVVIAAVSVLLLGKVPPVLLQFAELIQL